jgi:hypothetical protein
MMVSTFANIDKLYTDVSNLFIDVFYFFNSITLALLFFFKKIFALEHHIQRTNRLTLF